MVRIREMTPMGATTTLRILTAARAIHQMILRLPTINLKRVIAKLRNLLRSRPLNKIPIIPKMAFFRKE